MNLKKILFTSLLLLLFNFFLSPEVEAQRRQRPGSMSHNDQEFNRALNGTPTKCKYVSDGHTFGGETFITEGQVPLKVGNSTLTLRNGKYTLKFTATDIEYYKYTSRNRKKLMRERLDNFTMTGKYETLKKGGVLFLRLYDTEEDTYLTDIILSGPDTQYFELDDEGLLFQFQLK